MLDLAIVGGRVVDGSGNPPFWADVGIAGDRIAFVGKISPGLAQRVIDAAGLVVCPGFIDIHSHSDDGLLVNPLAESKVRQGVTTEVIGNCGYSLAPLYGEARDVISRDLAALGLVPDWASFGEYLDRLEAPGISLNVAALVGHATVREAVMGFRAQEPSAMELERMGALVGSAMKEGAFGLSTGLVYPPGSYARTREIIQLSRIVASFGGLYASHIRDEGDGLEEATLEAIEIGQNSGVRVEIAHHKASGPPNWGKVRHTLGMMEEAREGGVDVTCDVYPYTASSTGLSVILPGWMAEGGPDRLLARLRDVGIRERIRQDVEAIEGGKYGWDKTVISMCSQPQNKAFEGKNLLEVAAMMGKEPFDAALDLLADDGGTTQVIRFVMCEEDVRAVIAHPLSSIGSDAMVRAPYGVLSRGKPHPRSYGTFPRVIARYVKEEGCLRLEEAIRKMTSAAALRVGIPGRGLLWEGMYADIVVFDYDEIMDLATFENPQVYPAGIRYVVVNGKVTVECGEHTGARAGRVLRKAYLGVGDWDGPGYHCDKEP